MEFNFNTEIIAWHIKAKSLLPVSRGAPSLVETLREIAKSAKTELVQKFRESGEIAKFG